VSKLPFTAHVLAFGKVGCLYQQSTNVQDWMWADLDTGDGWHTPNFGKLSKLPLDDSDRQFTVEGEFSGSVGFNAAISTSPL
jgi:hypothetical protein